MPFSVLFLTSLTLSYLPVSLSYRDGARSESCYNMLVEHTDFHGNVVPPMECGNPCQYNLRVVGRVNAENTLNPMETTYQFEEIYHLQLTSTPGSMFEGFMVEARERTVLFEEGSTPTEEDFDNGSTIWGTWVTDLGSGYDPNMNLVYQYHTVECNRSLTSSEGAFENAATHSLPDDLTSVDLYWRAPPPPNSIEEYLQLPQQIRFWFVTVQQRLTYFYPIAGPILNRECSIPGMECLNNGTFNCRTGTCDCLTGFTGSNCSVIDCGPLNDTDNGRVDTPQGTTLNQVANYTCNNQYLLVGNTTRTCQADGMWSGNEPFCQLECLNNGTFNTSTEICDCPTGFTGSNCSVVDCGALTNPDNGQVDTPQGTTLNQVATYTCNNGYLLVGSMTRTCQANGMWSGNEPFCQLVCLNGGTFNNSTEICDCPTGFARSDCSATAAPTSAPTVTPTQLALNNALTVTLPQYTAETFTEGPQEAMRNTTATVINRYCAQNNEMCRQTVRTRRQVSLIQPSDVIITNIRNNAQGVLEFEMYIQVAGGAQVLRVEVLESAVQSGMNDYMAAGFAAVTFVRAVPTATTATTTVTTATVLPPGVIAAIAAGSVFGVVLVLILLLLCILFCIHKRLKRYRQVQLTYTSVLEKPENQYVVQNELATVDSPTEDDTQTDGTEKDDTQKEKDDTKKDGTQAENDPEDTTL